MRIMLVTENHPNPATGGGALTAWTLLQHLIDAKHQVSAALLVGRAGRSEEAQGRRRALQQMGVEVHEIPFKLPAAGARGALTKAREFVQPPYQRVFPGVAAAPALQKLLAERKPDALLAYHWLAIAAVRDVQGVPKLATAGDPPAFVGQAQAQLLPPSPTRVKEQLRHALAIWTHARHYRYLLAPFDGVGLFAAHHAAWIRSIGVPECRYIRTPVPDPGPGSKAPAPRAKPRILLIGHLGGTATQTGLDLFARDVLPALTRRFGEDGFEVHIVGGYRAPAGLEHALRHPAVRFRGHVEPADEEFRAADVQLVPTPVKLGIRVRILVGWSLGTPIVAHAANGMGIPELRDGENALVAGDGPGLADAVVRLLDDEMLRDRLRTGGRATYVQHFAPGRAAADLEMWLRAMTEDRR